MAKPGRNKTARAWLRGQGHKHGAKQMQVNTFTDPGRYKTKVREKQQRHTQPGKVDSIIEADEGMTRQIRQSCWWPGMSTYIR